LKNHITVVIPCYNHAQYLPDAIASVLQQTRAASEIIVVDDGSTDDTAKVAASFGDAICYLYQPNGGLSAARNTGIRAAGGDYIGLLDSDDLWLPDYLSVLGAMLDDEPRLGAVYGGSQFVDAGARPLSQTVTKTYPPEALHSVLVRGAFFPPSAVVMRKTALEQVGLFDTGLRACEDWDMWLRISAQFPFGGSSRVLALYRMHGNNMTADLSRMQESHHRVVAKHFGPDDGDPALWSPDKQRAYAGIYLWQSLALYQRHDEANAFPFLKRAFFASPELTASLDTFYMLGCADQPPGYVGDLETLDLERNSTRLLGVLGEIFSDPTVPERLLARKSNCYGLAYLALGILAYRKRDLKRARRSLMQAVRYQPGLAFDSRWSAPFAKSFAGTRLLHSWTARKESRRFVPAKSTR